jgi:hypothetical protein
MTKYFATKTAGVVTVHLPHTSGNYYTLCGEDGDDPSVNVDSVAVDVPKGAKINCPECTPCAGRRDPPGRSDNHASAKRRMVGEGRVVVQ